MDAKTLITFTCLYYVATNVIFYRLHSASPRLIVSMLSSINNPSLRELRSLRLGL